MYKLRSLYSSKAMILLALIATAFISCSKDDDDDVSMTEMEGTWKMESMEYEGMSTYEVNGNTFMSDFSGDARDISAEVDLNADGTYVSRGSYTIDVTVEILGQMTTLSSTVSNFLGAGTYEIKGDKMIVTNSQGETSEARIVSLSGDKLVMAYSDSDTTMDQGATTTTEVEGTYTFRRQ